MKQLFGSGRTLVNFAKAELRRNRDGARSASLTFKVKLNGNSVRSTPEFIRESYTACKSAQREGQIDGAIEVQNVSIYATDKTKSPAMKLKAVIFDHIVLRRSMENDIYLTMKTSLGIDDRIGKWVNEAYGTELFAEFEEAQGKLFDPEDEEGQDDSEDSPVLSKGEDTEAAGDTEEIEEEEEELTTA